MKRTLLTIALVALLTQLVNAQWTTGSGLIYYNGGNVGIGTTTPAYKLHVTTAGQLGLGLTGNSSSFAGADLGITRSSSSSAAAQSPSIQFSDIASNSGSLIQSYQGQLQFLNIVNGGSWAEAMRILANGNVGIGTTTPGYKFEVSGMLSSFQNGQTGLHLYNGGSVAEWLIQQKSQSDNNLSFTKSASGVQNDYLVITPNGNIGIGTSAPPYKLSVVNTSQGGLGISGNSSSYIGADFVVGRNTSSSNIGQSPSIEFYDNATTYANMIQAYQGQLQFWTSASSGWLEAMRINTNGNIGVETSNPLSKFQVDDGNSMASIGDASGTALNYGTSYLGFNAARNGSSWTSYTDGTHNGGGVIYSGINGDMYFATVPNTGNTNQSNPDATIKSNIKMMISGADGSIHAKQIYVQATAFPDYVFKKGYYLRPLSEVKTYIDQNNHLPEMPAAAQIEKDGLNLGEINKLLTKKVEELTLYLINLQKQVDQLKTKVK